MPPAAAKTAQLAWRAPRAAGHDAARFEPPPRVPGYRVLRLIGTGRRTAVWLAFDLNRRADVVLKIEAAPGESLQRDCAVAARVQGRNLVQVHGQGRTSAFSFIAMEHVEGGDLAPRMRAGVTPAEALALIGEAAQALAQLHRQQLVHRDVKPANFLLRRDGSLVLADFGLVTEAGAVDPASQPGAIVGTPRYVAPEQLQGAPAAPAADVYSLGVLLHEMLAGTPPFSGETLMEVLSQHLVARHAPLPSALAALQPLVDRMLAKEVQNRLPDADAVLGLLGQRWLP
jgi:eukaryotic-like serine/threonine-protein kinase